MDIIVTVVVVVVIADSSYGTNWGAGQSGECETGERQLNIYGLC
jgi:hypothetical protein